MWIDDVVSHQTIRSTWGNSIRDRIVQTFDTLAERDTHLATLPNGAVVFVAETGLLYDKVQNAWRPLQAAFAQGTAQGGPHGGGLVQIGETIILNSMNLPGGFRFAHIEWVFRVTQAFNANWSITAALALFGGTWQAGDYIGAIGSSADFGATTPQTLQLGGVVPINPNGDVCQGSIANHGAGSISSDVTVAPTVNYHRLTAVLFP